MTQTSSKPECKGGGVVRPVIDRRKCEGKEDCVRVCPYGVFEIGVLNDAERAALPVFPYRLKAWAHGYKQAFASNGDRCHGCGLCVTACPEKAIRLEATGARSVTPDPVG
jgi:NAD-dependent dihydropyrimidine dehydrogenase PreA subunit